MRHYRIAAIPGDGIGPEVTAEAVRALLSIARLFQHEFEFQNGLLGGAAIDATGLPLPPALHHCTRAASTRAWVQTPCWSHLVPGGGCSPMW